jgi:hypothetical protein
MPFFALKKNPNITLDSFAHSLVLLPCWKDARMQSEAGAAGDAKRPPRVFTHTTVHICAFTFLLHLKPSEPHLGTSCGSLKFRTPRRPGPWTLDPGPVNSQHQTLNTSPHTIQ